MIGLLTFTVHPPAAFWKFLGFSCRTVSCEPRLLEELPTFFSTTCTSRFNSLWGVQNLVMTLRIPYPKMPKRTKKSEDVFFGLIDIASSNSHTLYQLSCYFANTVQAVIASDPQVVWCGDRCARWALVHSSKASTRWSSPWPLTIPAVFYHNAVATSLRAPRGQIRLFGLVCWQVCYFQSLQAKGVHLCCTRLCSRPSRWTLF